MACGTVGTPPLASRGPRICHLFGGARLSFPIPINPQSLMDTFMADFNDVEDDFRFDKDFICELYLRCMEFGNSLWLVNDEKKKQSEDRIKDVTCDLVMLLLVHRCRCEACVFLQSEMHKLMCSINLLFDYFKSIHVGATLPPYQWETYQGG